MIGFLSDEQYERACSYWSHNGNRLGAGSYATVYEHGETRAIRLGSWDRMYLEYARYCHDHEPKYGPKIYAIHELDTDTDNDYTSFASIVIMEQLESIDDTDIAYLFENIWSEPLEDSEDFEDLVEDLGEWGRSLLTREFLDYHRMIIEWGYDKDYSNDIHDHNVMLRQDSDGECLVITDPWG